MFGRGYNHTLKGRCISVRLRRILNATEGYIRRKNSDYFKSNEPICATYWTKMRAVIKALMSVSSEKKQATTDKAPIINTEKCGNSEEEEEEGHRMNWGQLSRVRKLTVLRMESIEVGQEVAIDRRSIRNSRVSQ